MFPNVPRHCTYSPENNSTSVLKNSGSRRKKCLKGFFTHIIFNRQAFYLLKWHFPLLAIYKLAASMSFGTCLFSSINNVLFILMKNTFVLNVTPSHKSRINMCPS